MIDTEQIFYLEFYTHQMIWYLAQLTFHYLLQYHLACAYLLHQNQHSPILLLFYHQKKKVEMHLLPV